LLGHTLVECGCLDEAGSLLEEGIKETQSSALHFPHALTLLHRAEWLLKLGKLDDADQDVQEASRIISAQSYRGLEPQALRIRATVMRAGGAASLPHVEQALLEATARAGAWYAFGGLRTQTRLAQLYTEQGEQRRASDLLAAVCGSLSEGIDTPVVQHAKGLIAAFD
jgi:hypothetical protein